MVCLWRIIHQSQRPGQELHYQYRSKCAFQHVFILQPSCQACWPPHYLLPQHLYLSCLRQRNCSVFLTRHILSSLLCASLTSYRRLLLHLSRSKTLEYRSPYLVYYTLTSLLSSFCLYHPYHRIHLPLLDLRRLKKSSYVSFFSFYCLIDAFVIHQVDLYLLQLLSQVQVQARYLHCRLLFYSQQLRNKYRPRMLQ